MQIKTIKRYYFLNNRVANHKESVALGIIKYVCIGSIIHMCFMKNSWLYSLNIKMCTPTIPVLIGQPPLFLYTKNYALSLTHTLRNYSQKQNK